MNGAEALISSLGTAGIEVCFANPGTSEMQLVAAIDDHPSMRAVLGLFEGVVTGAADGYGRMADKPAATLLHLGPGLANGFANLHNARRAHAPIVNIVGDHADYHLALDAPLTSDIEGIANAVSSWVKTSSSANALSVDGVDAVAHANTYPGQISTLIAPANFAWDASSGPVAAQLPSSPPSADEEQLEQTVNALTGGEPALIFLGGRALREDALDLAASIASKTGAKLMCETFPARLQRGAGRVPVERLPYFGEMATEALRAFKHIILVGAKEPISFFAYPGKPSRLVPDGTNLVPLASVEQDAEGALLALSKIIGADPSHDLQQTPQSPPIPEGKLDAMGIGAVIGSLLPEGAVVSDESATAGVPLFALSAGAPKHDWMTLTGGSIGQGLPLAIGAAVAAPDRKTICLQADGSGMYTVQALWTIARENLDVTTVIIKNSSYAILNIEFQRVGVSSPGPKALSLLDLSNPAIDWVSIAKGMGVSAVSASSVEAFKDAFETAMTSQGPFLIEADITSSA